MLRGHPFLLHNYPQILCGFYLSEKCIITEYEKYIFILRQIFKDFLVRFSAGFLLLIIKHFMLSKIQKTWLWIFGAMFVVSEVIFSIIISSIVNWFNGEEFITLHSFFIDSRFFINHWPYFFGVLIIEMVGVLGLFIISLRLRKKMQLILLGIIFLWLIFIFFIGYLSNSINSVI